MNRKYYSLEKNKEFATLNIYGDITSSPWFEGDVSSAALSKQLETMKDVSEINVYINSYGGEVAEGLAIYNALKRHKAKVRTYCDGFAASIASVIFMAGDERIMNSSSLLMIHNAWTITEGNAEELRKQADALDKITKASIEAYKMNSSLEEDEIKALMDAETWILPEEAISYGFATSIEKEEKSATKQNAFKKLFEIICEYRENIDDEEEPDDTADEDEQENPEEPEVEPEENPDDQEEENPDENPDEEPEEAENPEDEPEEPENPADDESEEEPTDDEVTEDEEEAENDEEVAQKWGGFFNAILKM